MQNFRSQYLGIYRLLLLLLAILVPVFSFTMSYFQGRDHSIPFIREFITLLGLSILIGTYKSKWVRSNIQQIMIGLYAFLYLWQFWVLKVHEFHANNELAFLIIATAVCVGFERKKPLVWFLIASWAATLAVTISLHPKLGEAVIFLMTLTAIYVMIFLINIRKFKAENSVVEYATQLQVKNQEIIDSISYAKRIQLAILPSKKLMNELLPNSFVLYKPKDIVAGDFYWLEPKDGSILFAAADCTGHGVPGAMVSVICNNGLNRSVREHGLSVPGEILNKTREIVIQEFEKSEDEVKDGMDIALCALNGMKLSYAGAHNPLWIIREGELLTFKADKQPIGKHLDYVPYHTHEVDLQKGDVIYVFSDGYADQFGGEKGKKFRTSNMKKLLLSIYEKPMQEQKELLNQTFETWQGDLEQLDDVCVIGVRV
jgi:serine phosphatase RsbU (regulator of sigma subunit)